MLQWGDRRPTANEFMPGVVVPKITTYGEPVLRHLYFHGAIQQIHCLPFYHTAFRVARKERDNEAGTVPCLAYFFML